MNVIKLVVKLFTLPLVYKKNAYLKSVFLHSFLFEWVDFNKTWYLCHIAVTSYCLTAAAKF
jgi:hypothetical protein